MTVRTTKSRWAESAPAVEAIGVQKRYGSVLACDSVDLVLRRGQIHGVLGENGAGKSTLMKILIGLVEPDGGELRIDGARSVLSDPIDAAAQGIGMVHQHFSVIDALTVWENIALGDQKRLDPAGVKNEIADLSRHYGLALEPDAVVGSLTAGLRQRVEIIKCLRRKPRTVILDEPTSVLTPQESEQLFAALQQVVDDEGLAIALVTHKLAEALNAADMITIMRHGKVVGHGSSEQWDSPGLARLMIGRPVSLQSERSALGMKLPSPEVASTRPAILQGPAADGGAKASVRPAKSALTISSVTLTDNRGCHLLDGLTLSVNAGEIVGVVGVEGNGQRPLADLLSSLLSVDSGHVQVLGSHVLTGVAGAMGRAGVAVIPEERHHSGIVLGMTVAENLALAHPDRLARWGIMDRAAIRSRAEQLIDRFSIQCDGANAAMSTLSGGNQQRVVLARELADNPHVLVAAQPTRGLDVGAIDYMFTQLRTAALAGVAVLLISTDLDEILGLADRLVVLSGGRVVGEMTRDEVDIEALGLMMGGSTVPLAAGG